MFDYEKFRVNLKLNRKILKVTQEDIANEVDMSEKNLSRIEKAIQEPNLPTIIAILNYFNCTVDQFMNFSKDSEKLALINKINGYVSDLSHTDIKLLCDIIKDYKRNVNNED